LTVRGNGIVIDHGWGVFTGYYHLSKIEVTVGQVVKPGDEIALSGNTGLSTGAHLHWDMRIRGLNVDAMQFTQRAFP
jgi:murein DD-endopeptidase MepM/ murein hydrolase activator NlpD